MMGTKCAAIFLTLIVGAAIGIALIMTAVVRSRAKAVPPPDFPPIKETMSASGDTLLKSAPIGERPKPTFDPEDRLKSEKLFIEMFHHDREIGWEPNPLIRKEKRKTLQAEWDYLKGQKVQWRFPIYLSEIQTSSGDKYVIQSGQLASFDWFIPNGSRVAYRFSTRGPGQPVELPQLVVGRDITKETFRQLKGGEEIIVQGEIDHIAFSEHGRILVSIVHARMAPDSLVLLPNPRKRLQKP